MKKRNMITMLIVLCLLAMTFTACSGVAGPEGLGHRYGNPEIAFADGQVTITYICVDCDYTETEVRTVSTQVTDGAAWDAAFQNLSLTTYSLLFYTDNIENGKIQNCIVTEDRAYYSSEPKNEADPNRGESYAAEPENKEECYTLQKTDGTYITYLRSAEDGSISLALETDSSYYDDIRSRSATYLSLEGMFDKFTYDAERGSYICADPIKVALRDADGISLGEKTMRQFSISIADGQILHLAAEYEETNEYLETITVVVNFYNIGYSVVKVPQSFIEAVAGSGDAEQTFYHYEILDGEVTITGVKTDVGGVLTIPATLDGYPVTAIGEIAFKDCVNVTDVIIPESVSTIGNNAFYRCMALTNVFYGGTQEQWGLVAIGDIGNEALLNATIRFRGSCEHTYGEGVVTKQPTCGAEGIKTYTCTECGATKEEYLEKVLIHSYDEGVVAEEPSCKEAGIKTYTCTECGKNKTEYIPKTGTHQYTNGTCIHCGADDPHYTDNTNSGEKEIGGIIGAILRLIRAIIELFSFF